MTTLFGSYIELVAMRDVVLFMLSAASQGYAYYYTFWYSEFLFHALVLAMFIVLRLPRRRQAAAAPRRLPADGGADVRSGGAGIRGNPLVGEGGARPGQDDGRECGVRGVGSGSVLDRVAGGIRVAESLSADVGVSGRPTKNKKGLATVAAV